MLNNNQSIIIPLKIILYCKGSGIISLLIYQYVPPFFFITVEKSLKLDISNTTVIESSNNYNKSLAILCHFIEQRLDV